MVRSRYVMRRPNDPFLLPAVVITALASTFTHGFRLSCHRWSSWGAVVFAAVFFGQVAWCSPNIGKG